MRYSADIPNSFTLGDRGIRPPTNPTAVTGGGRLAIVGASAVLASRADHSRYGEARSRDWCCLRGGCWSGESVRGRWADGLRTGSPIGWGSRFSPESTAPDVTSKPTFHQS